MQLDWATAPVTGMNVPTGHGVAVVEAAGQKCPVGQAPPHVGRIEPVSVPREPAEH
jgi:hypothetical protein